MSETRKSPAELRSMFGANLRQLARTYPSISELSRQLGINRTQFNRYLSGESFPRPDVLARICDFFDVDARVLLEPVAAIEAGDDPLNTSFLGPFLGRDVSFVPEETFPSGFYRFSRRSFLDQSKYVIGLVWVFRNKKTAFIRGFEARAAMAAQGLPMTRAAREFRGMLFRQEDGVASMISRQGSRTASFNFLTRVSSFEQNYWVGYVARTVRESPDSERVVRMVYEYLGTGVGPAKAAGKAGGYCTADALLPFHSRLLQPDTPFR
ncbi:helix-turn-helix domain-containing protein [Tateyamaria sp. SN6-1]|uniref:helix-turn-helix domain-containing protein n=1 Tax=Tateyamaria sp. SN6-1 TaxID=3092148 RepID=UPI0039F5756A